MDEGKGFGAIIKEHLFVFVSLAILATLLLYGFIAMLAGYSAVAHAIVMFFLCTAAIGNAAFCFIKTKSLSVEVVFALVALIITFFALF